jgi:TPR repeat protein
MYLEGDGAGLDEDKALFWFGKVCEETPIHMGFMYEEGFPMIRNIDDAVWWYRFSADTGDPNGLCNLGNLYC